MASTSSQTPYSPTSFSTPTRWDVFLSFRGKDTRHGFTSHLYSALDRYNIPTFMDDPALRCGEVISDALRQAIKESKIYIVVFSENYASSSWCLDELVEILYCSNTMQRLVIPVFYNILPAVVRYQIGSFQEHFRTHEARFAGDMDRVHTWRLTLKQVADMSGKHVDRETSEADIVNVIVDEILLQIKPTVLDVARYPVGLDSRVKYITSLLSSGTRGVIKIGIYGMGGIGKTTLAKALFNQLLLGSFRGSCFLVNVREISGTVKGLESLQKQLINDVLKSTNKVEVSSVYQGTELIKARICSKKILVVIDDLDDLKEFKSLVGPFASGSVVIITTRDEEILDNIEVETIYRYRVDELNDAESETLLLQHAFGDTKPNNSLTELSKEILRLAGGLPLALEVFGSYLYKKPEVRWKSYIEMLQRNPNSTIQQRLVISLDALESDDPLLKKMFLDFACFFIGRKKKEVVEILETYYPYTDDKIDILMKKCLLTINDDGEVRMHDLLQEMGKEVARNKSPDEPGKYSRLWVPEDICYVLEGQKGTEAIEVIMLETALLKEKKVTELFEGFMLSEPMEVSLSVETLRRLIKLRFLYLGGIHLTGNFKGTLEDLRWFYWDRCPLQCFPFDFCPKKLVSLEFPNSQMTTMWDVNMDSDVFSNLKTLNMSFSQYLTKTPDFRRLPCLENLNLESCTSLKEVHISIGSLVSLVSLNLKCCKSLRSLPDTICNLRALKVLCIESCIWLKSLPMQLGNIESLTELNAFRLNVQKLPDSIGNLHKLVKLKLDYNQKLKSLPNTICNLRALEVLSVNHCIKVKALPVELGKIESLRKLKAAGLAVSKLPDSIGYLKKLVKLKLDYNRKLEYLPNTICNLRALEVLSIESCSKLEALPVELGNIESLREFKASRIRISKLPNSICNMRSLEILRITFFHKLEILPDQLWRLTRLLKLDASGAPLLKKLPDIKSSQISFSLTYLSLSWSKITALPSGISQLSNLQELDLVGCRHLLSIAELPPNMWCINANGCTSLERVNLSNLKLLEKLFLTNCSALKEILGLGELTSIELMHLEGCQSSLVERTLTKSLFQIYSAFKQQIDVNLESAKFPDWIIQSSVKGPASEDLTEEISTGSAQSKVYDFDLPKEIYGSGQSNVSDDDSTEEISDGNNHSNVDEDDSAEEISDGRKKEREGWGFSRFWHSQSNVDEDDSAEEILDGSSQSNVDDDDLTEEISDDGSSRSNVDEDDLTEEISDDGSSQDDSDLEEVILCKKSKDDFHVSLVSSSVNLQSNLSHNYLGMVLCFEMQNKFDVPYHSVRTSANNILQRGNLIEISGSGIVIVPRSIFRVTDADHTIEFESGGRRHWIHLLYKNENDNTTVNVEDERNNPSASDLKVEEGGGYLLNARRFWNATKRLFRNG